MLTQEHHSRSFLLSLWLLFTILILLGSMGNICADSSTTYYASDYNVLNGTYVSGSVPASLQTLDSNYLSIGSSPSATFVSSCSPSSYSPLGNTSLVSGATGDLASNNDAHMVYHSYPSRTSPKTLYAHQETTTIGGNSYYFQQLESADSMGTSLSASMAATGRHLLGRYVYPLAGISSIPASTWTQFYRTWRDPDPSIAYDSVGSGNNGDGTQNITWSHVVGSGTNRFMMIGVSVKTVTVSALSVTVGGQSATFLRSDVRAGEVRGEIWYLVDPSPGSKAVTVTLSGQSKASGGSVSYTGVDLVSPIDNHRGNVSYGGINPSISLTTTTANDWIFSNLAISGNAQITAHGSGQVHRCYDVALTGGSGSSRAGVDGDDKPTTAPGSYAMFWNMSFYSNVAAQAVAIKPAPTPVGHVDVDIMFLKSDGTIRTAIATNVADSSVLTSTPTVLSGTYSWAAYTVVDQTDYLEIDYYAEVASATSGVLAYFRVDDGAMPVVDQTRSSNIMLPSEYTVEVEFTGASNAYDWTQLQWAVDSAWTNGDIAVTVQLYNHTSSAYPNSGDGFISYTSNATANTDEAKTQTMTVNSKHFRDAAGNWKIKAKGVKAVDSPFDFKVDWVEFTPTYYSEYTVSTEFMFSSMTNEPLTQLNFTVVSEYDVVGVSVTLQIWNYSASVYVSGGQGYLKYTSSGVNETEMVSIDANPQFYTSNGTARIRVMSVLSAPTQYRLKINQVGLVYVTVESSSLKWTSILWYLLPVPFAVLLLLFLGLRRRNNKKVKPLVQKRMGTFSGQFGMKHGQMVGKKMLLEIDPTSDYNIALSSFVSEAKGSGESLFIVTNRNSALHSVFSEAGNVNFLLLTSNIHYAQQISERETLLPASDLSLLLDTCSRIAKVQNGKTVYLLFDNLSDIILRCEFEKTYQFTRLLLEAISSSKTTALFVFIPTAHDQEISSSIRGLFQHQLVYTKNGPEIGNL